MDSDQTRNAVSKPAPVAIVTGAGRGLGLAYAQALAAAGTRVVVNDVDPVATEQAVADISRAGGEATAHPAAIGPTSSADALVARAVEVYGRLDAIVTNAGILRDAVLWKMTDDDFDAVIDVHLRGTFTCVRAAARHFRAQGEGGRVVCIGSPTGQHGTFGQTNYAAAKSGIVGMVRTWALELARANVMVNAVVPVAATAMTETMPLLAPYAQSVGRGEPLPAYARRDLGFGAARDAAGLVVFLCSQEAEGITGQVVGIGGDRLTLWSHPAEVAVAYSDGGWSAKDIESVWADSFAHVQQRVGPQLPEPPA